MPSAPLIVLACFVALTSANAAAAPCAGFADVDDTDPFCPSVTWVKNRGVTHGCGDGSLYCPESVVTRKQMAAFLSRMQAVLPLTVVNAAGTALGVYLTSTYAEHWLFYRSGGKPYAIRLEGVLQGNDFVEIVLDVGALAFDDINCTGNAYLYRRSVPFAVERGEVIPTQGGHRLYAPDRSRGSMYKVKSAYIETPNCVPWDTDVEGFPAVFVEDLGPKFTAPLRVE